MKFKQNILEAIGGSPLVRLNRIAPADGAEIYAKCEYTNPGGSVKDRMAVYIVRKAIERGDLKPGGIIVENTSGNTGAGLALIAAVYGCKLIVTMPDKMSAEKINTLRAFGAKVVVTPTNVPADHPDSYYETAIRIARETPGAFYVNQYHSKDNIQAHYELTGRELFEEVGDEVDAIVMGVGTGGTISGVGRYFKEHAPNTKIIGVDPIGSVYYDLFKTGKMPQPHVYKVEGIGEDMICGALDMSVIDDIYQVNDKQCFVMGRRLAREEGLFVGGSSGGAAHVAIELARRLGPGKKIVTIFPDHGDRYLSKMYNDEWMRVNGFLEDTDEPTAEAILASKGGVVVWTDINETIADVSARLKQTGFSQFPVKDAEGNLCGTVSERKLLTALVSGLSPDESVSRIAEGSLPVLHPKTTIGKLNESLLSNSAVLVGTSPKVQGIQGILTRIDIIEFIEQNRCC
jgi:cystathionine beta-synthase